MDYSTIPGYQITLKSYTPKVKSDCNYSILLCNIVPTWTSYVPLCINSPSKYKCYNTAQRRVVGVDAKILDGEQEAALSYQGATIGLSNDERPTLIVDIGGGSSELALMHEGVLEKLSMQLGCVRVTERALGSAVVDQAHDRLARAMIDEEIDRAFSRVPAFSRVVGTVRLVGLAGTVATLAQLDAGLATYQRELVHHRVLDRACVERWRVTLARETPQQRLEHPGMVRGREDVLTAGLYVLGSVMDRFGASELLTSENDILDGIAQTLLA